MNEEIDESEWHWDDEDWTKKDKIIKDDIYERVNNSKEVKETSNSNYFPSWLKAIAAGLIIFAGPIGWIIGTFIIFRKTNNSVTRTFALMDLAPIFSGLIILAIVALYFIISLLVFGF